MRKILILGTILLAACAVWWFFLNEDKPAKIAAYIRVKNEVNTIEATLKSIDGLFDKIVIIYVDELDDGTIAIMKDWCGKHSECEMHAYPHTVVPGRNPRYYQNQVPFENSLAAYYMFGLQFFEPKDWVVRIDGDQIYIREQLAKTLNFIRHEANPKAHYGMTGYNTYVHDNKLVKYGLRPINGGSDSFIIQRRFIESFIQTPRFEVMRTTKNLPMIDLDGLHWFHYMKHLKSDDTVRPLTQARPDEVAPLTPVERALYEKAIVPLIPETSPYKYIEF